MKKNNIAQAVLTGLVSLSTLAGVTDNAVAATAAPTKEEGVKCYGVAAASKNDCGTVISACAATVKDPNVCYAWIMTPKGLCEKIAGSSVGKPALGCKGPDGKPVTQ